MNKPHLISAPPKLWHLVQRLEAAGIAAQLTPISQLNNRRRPRISRQLHRTLAHVQPN